MGLAAAYYFLPKLANTPIHSHRLSMIGFWSIAFVYGWIGAHHMMHGPISQWLQTVAVIFSIWLFIPVFTVVHNLFYTLLPEWKKYTQSAPIRFLMMGIMFYFVTCIQGPLMALRNINEITSKTDWVIGHSHVVTLWDFYFLCLCGNLSMHSGDHRKTDLVNRMATWHFNLNIIGSIPFMLAFGSGGSIKGCYGQHGPMGHYLCGIPRGFECVPFPSNVADMRPWWILRAIGGGIILIANVIFAINIFNTVILKEREK